MADHGVLIRQLQGMLDGGALGGFTCSTTPTAVLGQFTNLIDAPTLVRTGVGVVTLDIHGIWAQIYAAPIVAVAGGAVAVQFQQVDNNTMKFACFNTASGAAQDATFYAIVYAFGRQ